MQRLDELRRLAETARDEGREVVAVLGLGYVGTAVAASLARRSLAEDDPGGPGLFVIGIEQDTRAGRERAQGLDAGHTPLRTGDAELERTLERAAVSPRRLAATVDLDAAGLADVVVCCIGLEVRRAPGQVEEFDCSVREYAAFLRELGRVVRPGALLLIESTLPLGACDRLLYPAFVQGQAERGVDVDAAPPSMAYCPERVTPGGRTLASVLRAPRAFAGVDELSAERAERFLARVTEDGPPPWRHASTRATELTKLMENAYRATNIAFVEEWAKLAEDAGVDLWDVIASIRVRTGTHDNMMGPGLGVGGHCLPKDALLAAFGARELLGIDAELPFSRQAVLTNERMPERAVDVCRQHFPSGLKGKRALVLGITYLPHVGDTRSSPAEPVVRALGADGAEVTVVDATVTAWPEVPELAVHASLEELGPELAPFDVVLVSLPDPGARTSVRRLLPEGLTPDALVLDPWNALGDDLCAALVTRGITVRVFGRGDLPTPPRES